MDLSLERSLDLAGLDVLAGWCQRTVVVKGRVVFIAVIVFNRCLFLVLYVGYLINSCCLLVGPDEYISKRVFHLFFEKK